MARPIDPKNYATKKELEKHKREVTRMISRATKDLKKWDKKQDSVFQKKKSRKKSK